MSELPAAGHDGSGRDRVGIVVTEDAASEWFVREILPLEATLMHYLRSNWRNASDISDLRQEVYARVLQAARQRTPDASRRFLLSTARHLLIDLVRRQQVVPIESFADIETFDVPDQAPEPEHVVIENEELRRVKAALMQLPPRTREAVDLAYFEGLSGIEIAKRLGVSQQMASKFIAKGTLALGRILYGARLDRSPKS
jgi:RNA polymerase sigma factor (sigma-70 family)